MSDTEPLVRIRDLRYRYPGAHHDVLRIPFLDVSGAGLIAVTGPSGAGKSTLIEILAGTLRGDYTGSVQVLGREWSDLHRDAERQRHLRRIGFIPQDYGLLTDRSVAALLRQDLSDSGSDPSEHTERIVNALREVALDGFEDRQVAALSGGQRQRVAIARMLARDVELVIADEPTANLDPTLAQETLALFRRLAERSPVLIITHDPAVAAACDRTIVLQSMVADAEPPIAPPSRRPGRRRRTGWVAAAAALALVGGVSFAIAHAESGTPIFEQGANATKSTTVPANPLPVGAYSTTGSSSTTGASSSTAVGSSSTAAGLSTTTVGAPTTTVASPSTTKEQQGAAGNPSSVPSGQVEGPLPLPSGSPASPDLATLLPPNAHVVSENWVRLDGNIPQVVTTYTEPSSKSPSGTSTDLVLLAWDNFTGRWTSIFDAANAPAGSSTNQSLPTNAAIFGLGYSTITATPGRTDLAFWAGYSFGADSPSVADIVHYDGQTASVVYSSGTGTGKVTGSAPHQQLSLTGDWVDPVDAECCGVRSYTQTIGWNPSPLPGQRGYVLLSDTRSWMGVYVATKIGVGGSSSPSSPPPPVVMSVVPNSPAAGVLQPGDQLLSVAGIPQPSNQDLLGPQIIEQIDSQQPGTVVALTIERGGQQLEKNVTLSSYANPAEGQAIPPSSGFLGVTTLNGTTSGLPGAYIDSVESGSAAAQAGLEDGDVITSFGGYPISSSQDLSNALFAMPAGATAQLVYADSTGASHVVSVTLGIRPSSDSSGQEPVIDEI